MAMTQAQAEWKKANTKRIVLDIRLEEYETIQGRARELNLKTQTYVLGLIRQDLKDKDNQGR